MSTPKRPPGQLDPYDFDPDQAAQIELEEEPESREPDAPAVANEGPPVMTPGHQPTPK